MSGLAVLNNGQLDAALDDARADGVAGESGGVVDVEFLHEMLAMLLDGLDADASSPAVSLLALPSAMSWSTSISREVNWAAFLPICPAWWCDC